MKFKLADQITIILLVANSEIINYKIIPDFDRVYKSKRFAHLRVHSAVVLLRSLFLS